jgi:hypothetical protein
MLDLIGTACCSQSYGRKLTEPGLNQWVRCEARCDEMD